MKNSAHVSCPHLLKSPSTTEESLFCKLVGVDDLMRETKKIEITEINIRCAVIAKMFLMFFTSRAAAWS